MTLVLDVAQPIDPAAAKRAGATGLIGYLSSVGTVNGQRNPKIWTAPRLQAAVAAGLAVGFVYEDGAADMASGAPGGYRAASVALWELASLFNDAGWGDPSGSQLGVYLADDHNVVTDGAGAYVKSGGAVLESHGIRPGYYGNQAGAVFLLGVGVVHLGWGVSSWGSDVLGRCHLRQEANAGYLPVAGVNCDRNTALAADWGQWPRP